MWLFTVTSPILLPINGRRTYNVCRTLPDRLKSLMKHQETSHTPGHSALRRRSTALFLAVLPSLMLLDTILARNRQTTHRKMSTCGPQNHYEYNVRSYFVLLRVKILNFNEWCVTCAQKQTWLRRLPSDTQSTMLYCSTSTGRQQQTPDHHFVMRRYDGNVHWWLAAIGQDTTSMSCSKPPNNNTRVTTRMKSI